MLFYLLISIAYDIPKQRILFSFLDIINIKGRGEIFMGEKFVVVVDENFSEPMPKEEAIKKVKSYDDKTVNAYMVSEEEAKKLKAIIK